MRRALGSSCPSLSPVLVSNRTQNGLSVDKQSHTGGLAFVAARLERDAVKLGLNPLAYLQLLQYQRYRQLIRQDRKRARAAKR